jgi:hypothetical protein
MVSWRKAFLTTLKIIGCEFLIAIGISVLYATFGVTLFANIYYGLNQGSVLVSVIIFLIGFFCLGVLGLAVPIKILTELVSEETYALIAEGRRNAYSWLCPNCNQVNPAEARFCSICGKAFREVSQKPNSSTASKVPDVMPVKVEEKREEKPQEPVSVVSNEPPMKREFHKLGDGLFYIFAGIGVALICYFINLYLHISNFIIVFNSLSLIGLLVFIYGLFFIYRNYN